MKKDGINYPEPFIKWAGGKTQLINQITPHFPDKVERYFEPFIGGGAIFFYVKKKFKPKKVVISDVNPELINCYRVVRDHLSELIEVLRVHKHNHNKQYFYKIRNLEKKQLSQVEKAGRFIYLNKTCFNGLYRVNAKGKFNVPIGDYKKPSILQVKTLRKASNYLQGVDIRLMSYEKVMSFARKNDFIYFDPPYYPISSNSFTEYTTKLLLADGHTKLAGVYKKLNDRGCKVLLSNSYCNFVKKLYAGYNLSTVNAKRTINCIGSRRGKIKELLVSNYPKNSS